MRHIPTLTMTVIQEMFFPQKDFLNDPQKDYTGARYAGKIIMGTEETNQYIADLINCNKPFLVGRYGATELFCSTMFEFDIKSKQQKSLQRLCDVSGFFPNDLQLASKFSDLLIDSAKEVDVLGVWGQRWEDFYIKSFMPNTKLTSLFDLEPWRFSAMPWSRALKGKKVLIVHPFEESIVAQYKQRKLIFPGTDILPEFELKTFKAIQTIAGETDDRFATWFDALEYMRDEILKIDFDVAILGCGAYGLPLAALLKKAGKQAIHLGGATQILFGIKGKRWDEEAHYEYVRKYYNDNWIRPIKQEKPKNSEVVEEGCYW